jgi:hypothetical protein
VKVIIIATLLCFPSLVSSAELVGWRVCWFNMDDKRVRCETIRLHVDDTDSDVEWLVNRYGNDVRFWREPVYK